MAKAKEFPNVVVKQSDGWVVRHRVEGKLRYLKWFNSKSKAEQFAAIKKGLV